VHAQGCLRVAHEPSTKLQRAGDRNRGVHVDRRAVAVISFDSTEEPVVRVCEVVKRGAGAQEVAAVPDTGWRDLVDGAAVCGGHNVGADGRSHRHGDGDARPFVGPARGRSSNRTGSASGSNPHPAQRNSQYVAVPGSPGRVAVEV
jgi:hypothetical protein